MRHGIKNYFTKIYEVKDKVGSCSSAPYLKWQAQSNDGHCGAAAERASTPGIRKHYRRKNKCRNHPTRFIFGQHSLMFILIGIPIMIGVWIWGIVTGVQILKEAQA